MTPPPSRRRWSANDGLFFLLSAIVLLAPLPLGANRLWSWNLMAVSVAVLSLLWVGLRWQGRCSPGLPGHLFRLPALLYVMALGWGGVQLTSWFGSSPIWNDASTALAQPLPAPLSADPAKTIDALLRLTSSALVFFLAAQLGRQPHRAARGMKSLAIGITLYGLYALAVYFSGQETILWLDKWTYPGDATGTFVGRAAFGAFAGIGVVLCQAMALRQARSHRPALPMARSLSVRRSAPWVLAAVILWCAVLVSHSRGALLVTGLASVTLLLAATVGQMIRWRVTLIMLAALVVGGSASLLTIGQATIARMSGEGDWQGDRPNLMRLSWNAVADRPWTGHGLGAFEQAFSIYRDVSLPRDVIYDYAHNSWLEVIVDLGWPAGLCLLLAVCWPVVRCAIGLRQRHQGQLYPATALAIATLLGSQAIIDFTIQIPALTILWAYCLGIGYGQSWPTAQVTEAD